jgi:hypothetical protein
MLVLAMEFSRGTTACQPPPLPGNEEGTVRACTIASGQEAPARAAPKSDPIELTPTTNQWTVQERVVSDQLGVLSSRPGAQRSIGQQLTVTP